METRDVRIETRLRAAYERYDAASRGARPGTAAAAQLARARLDLVLVLEDAGEEFPDNVLQQISRDTEELLRTTPPLG
jgi:hypothetical protein